MSRLRPHTVKASLSDEEKKAIASIAIPSNVQSTTESKIPSTGGNPAMLTVAKMV